jgi:hypothetical protein
MTSERPEVASVEAVREELRRLGYLDSGIDRFVLAGAGAPSPLRACARAAFRVGLAGGALFGLAGTLAAVGLDRRLLAEPRDLVVLSLYLVVAAALGVGLIAFLGGLAAAWAGRRQARPPGPTLARNLGLFFAVAALLYLTFWFRTHLLGTSLVVQTAALVLGVGLSLALGRFSTLAAVAVLVAGGLGDRLPAAAVSRHQLRPVLVAAAVLFGGGVAAASLFSRDDAPGGPDFAVVPTGLRVRLVGIDGLERRMTQQMLARGEMPRLGALVAAGASGPLVAEPERVPAIVWTTIATGRGPEAHGIQSTGARRLAGLKTPWALGGENSPFVSALAAAGDLLRLTRTQPPSAVLRTVKTFWNVASEKGLRVGVVNWWATWPADAVNGYLVSDRAFFKLEKGGPPEREVAPAEAFETLRPLLSVPADDERPRRLDSFHVKAARLLRTGAAPDLEAVYLSGLDIFTMQKLGEAGVADLASLDERLAAVRAYYRFMDGLIGELASGLGPGDVLVLVGDPGRLARGATPPPEGTFLLAGGPTLHIDLGNVSSRDVAPTVLYLSGLPKSDELPGTVLESAFDADFRAAHPVRTVASYGRRPLGRSTESAFDRDMLEELKALGYIN